MKLTYEELEIKLTATLQALNETLQAFNETQQVLNETRGLLKLATERIAKLEEQLNKNSKNSSKPPSSDRKGNSQNSDKKKKSRHGINRKQLSPDEIDYFHDCKESNCLFCGSSNIADQKEVLVLQQIELPEVKAVATQFNRTKYACISCGKFFLANLPKGIPNSTFGPKLMALLATLTGVFHLSKRDVMLLVQNLYDVKISEGSIINVEERVANAINEVYERIHQHVMESQFPKHFDETSWRDSGKNHYIWVASTSKAVCFKIDPSRSKEAFQKFSRNLAFAPVVTDRYAVYNHVDQPHQYCLAHLIRDFRKYAERDGPDAEIGKAIEAELRKTCKNQREFREGKISLKSRDARFRNQKNRLQEYLLDGFANGSDELHSFCDRLLNKIHNLWTFSNFTDVDPTNNLAERDLRKLVIFRKKSYGTRSKRGQRFVERINTVAGTLKKSCNNIFNFFIESVRAFYAGESAPYTNFSFGF